MAERTRVIKRQISFLLKRNFEFENENRSKLDKTKTGLALSVNLLLNNCTNPVLPKKFNERVRQVSPSFAICDNQGANFYLWNSLTVNFTRCDLKVVKINKLNASENIRDHRNSNLLSHLLLFSSYVFTTGSDLPFSHFSIRRLQKFKTIRGAVFI